MSQTAGVRLGGLVLGSEDPDRLSAWYRMAFAPSAEVGTVLDLSSSRLIRDGNYVQVIELLDRPGTGR
jgi:hypothetical protein